MPHRVFVASPEVKEQGETEESEEAGGQRSVLVSVTGFDREAASPCAQCIAEIEGDLDTRGSEHFATFGIADQKEAAGERKR